MAPKFYQNPSFTKEQNKGNRSEERDLAYKDRRRKENSAEQESFFLQQLIFTSPDILFVLETSFPAKTITNSRLIKNKSKNHLHQLFTANNFQQAIFAEDLKALLDKMESCFSKEEQEEQDDLWGFDETEVRLLDQKNKIHFFSIRFSPGSLMKKDKLIEWFCQARNITSEKENLNAIEESEKKLQMALDGSNMGTWSYDPFRQRIDCDERTSKIIGLPKYELEKGVQSILSRIHPEDKNFVIQTAIKALKRNGRFNHEFRILTPGENQVRHIAVIGELISDERRYLTKLTGICLDISQHKIAENKIKTSEKFLDESQRIARIGCFDWDLSVDKAHCSRQLYEILEQDTESPFTLEALYEKIQANDLPQVKSEIINTIKNGTPFSKEFRFRSAGESVKVLWVNGQPLRNGNKTERIIGTIQDITEKTEKEKEFNTQSLIIKSILLHLPVIIEIIGKDGKIKSLLGPAGLERMGMSENESAGKNIFDENPFITPYIKRALKGETVNFTQEKEYNGKKLFFLSFFFYHPERELAIGLSIDITAQKQVEAAFQQISAKNQELERLNKVMDLFVYAVAHDLKNPINNLEMLNFLMEEAIDPQEQKEYMGALQKSVKRLKQTISGLTEIITMESSYNNSNKEVNFSDILDLVQADLHQLLLEKNGTIEASFQEPKIRINQTYLTSILKNLISNSIKYSSPGRATKVQVNTKKEAGYVVLTVKDNGIGIDLQQHQKNLFKPFKRFSQLADGTGVGLHLIKSMVEKSGGHIEVESTVGEGTTFRCFLKPFK